MQLSTAAIPTLEIVTQLVASTSLLIQGAEPNSIASDLSPSVTRWRSEHPELEDSLYPISSLLPPPFDDRAPVSEIPPSSLTRDQLARALRQAGSNLSTFSRGFEAELLGVLRKKLQLIIQESHPPPPLGVLSQPPPEQISQEVIRRQIADTVKILICGAIHDANNMLAVLLASHDEAEQARLRLHELASANMHIVPDGAERHLTFNLTLQRNLSSIRGYIDLTVALVREIQSVAGFGRKPSERDLMDIPRLFVDGGLIQRIGFALVDLLTGLQEAGKDLEEMNKIAQLYGHLVSEEDRNEGRTLRGNIGECLQTLQECTNLIVDLFGVLRSVAVRLGPANLHRNLNERLIGRVMGKGIAVTLGLDPEPWMIPGPEVYAWLIGMNLMVNARHAMAEKGELTVTTRHEILREEEIRDLVSRASLIRPAPRRGEYMRLQVRDTGTGIPSSVLPLIFDVGVSGKESSGLGLAVTLKIIEDMGGFIVVETAVDGPNRGTVFSVYFPRVDYAPAVKPSRPKSPKGNEVVLLVDDESSILRSMKRQLEAKGYRVLAAGDGEGALEACENWYREENNPAIDLVLLDVNMPGLRGEQLILRLRALDPEMACLFQSGGNLPSSLEKVGRSSFITKPSPIEDVIKGLRLLIE